MPEGDTIFRSARGLKTALAGRQVTGFETAYAQLASIHDNASVVGRTVDNVEARGKWLLISLSGDLVLVTHMLMNGTWHLYRPGERWRRPRSHMRIVLSTSEWQAVAFLVPVAQFHTARSLERHPAIPRLGPDLLAAQFSVDEATARLREQATVEVADAILNQRVIAGAGNVFKSEICFACGVNPFRLVSSLGKSEIECLLDTARKYLQANVTAAHGDSIVTYTGGRRTTGAANPGAKLWVYGRRGRPCRRCGTPILTRKQALGARSTYWCPQCQPMPQPVEADASNSAIEGWSNPIARRKVGCGS
ncbi:MAG TPA: DNA-formamidopyrimidine glycosylase family protein [Acidisarcina sp.]